MYDIRWIRENAAAFDRGLERRSFSETSSQKLLELDDTRRAAIARAQAAQERRNALSKEIGKAMGAKDVALAETLKAEVAALKAQSAEFEKAEADAIAALNEQLAAIPNTPFDEVPNGADEHGNVLLHAHGQKPEETGRLAGVNRAKEHYELGEALGQMDFETAAKLSGSRFVVLERQIARLNRAIGQFFLDAHVEEHGYTEVNPPLMVRDEVMFGTAQLPKFDYDQFRVTRTGSLDSLVQSERSRMVSEIEDSIVEELGGSEQVKIDDFLDSMGKLSDTMKKLGYSSDAISSSLNRAIARLQKKEVAKPALPESYWLIPTAEVPLTNLVRESILSEEELPRRYTALTPCFRAEAGSAGRDTRGMLRQHQFEKVELVSITTPEKSREEHERMLSCAENVLKKLDLHYRVMTLCTGDMGFASQKTYDIEVWLPGQKSYREISSCSVCGDFQARRMNARYRTKDGKGPFFVHTLNGSGTAVGRALIAVMENYQNADGSITVPEVLVPYMRGVTRIEKA